MCASSTPGASTDLLYSTMNRLAEAAIVLGGGGEGFSAALPSSEEVWAPIFDKSATLALLPLLLGLRLAAGSLARLAACVRAYDTYCTDPATEPRKIL